MAQLITYLSSALVFNCNIVIFDSSNIHFLANTSRSGDKWLYVFFFVCLEFHWLSYYIRFSTRDKQWVAPFAYVSSFEAKEAWALQCFAVVNLNCNPSCVWESTIFSLKFFWKMEKKARYKGQRFRSCGS